MKNLAWMIFAGFIAYSLMLISIECCTSQDYVRHYVADVEGPVRFYAVNTTVSVFLLWATALLFAVCLSCEQRQGRSPRATWFFASQIAVFAFLGLDDRFKAHEYIGWRLGIGDHFVLLAVAAFELVCLLTLGREIVFRRGVLIRLAIASAFFAVMLFFDAVVPHDAFLRLSLEDVAKTWATLFFCLFAWEILAQRIGRITLPPTQLAARATL